MVSTRRDLPVRAVHDAGQSPSGSATGDEPPRSGPHSHRAPRTDADYGPLSRALRRAVGTIQDWPVRRKMVAVVITPAIAFAFFTGASVYVSVDLTARLAAGYKLAELAGSAAGVVHELQRERDLTAGYLATGGQAVGNPLYAPLTRQQEATDRAVSQYRQVEGDVFANQSGPTVQQIMQNVRTELSQQLPRLRSGRESSAVTLPGVFSGYTRSISSLLEITTELTRSGTGLGTVSQEIRNLDHVSRIKEAYAQVRGTLYAVAHHGSFRFGEFPHFADLVAQERIITETFNKDATDAQRDEYAETVRGQAALAVERIQRTAVNRRDGQLSIDPEQWFLASSTQIEQLRNAEELFQNQLFEHADEQATGAARGSVVLTFVTAFIIGLALLISLLIARSMNRSLHRLRSGAFDVAQRRLPVAISRLESGRATPDDVSVEPIEVSTGDEIGQVARAFDAVHEQAIRLATDQAALRRSVSAMFVNLSRRRQLLVERQLQVIDDLERTEQDPAQLDQLFQLDHLATRMRRNDESLLVLAGSEGSTRRWSSPVPLREILLAAISEVEQYTRIRYAADESAAVVGYAVTDVIHLIAELLDNATAFSPPGSDVRVGGRVLRDGTGTVEIEDQGVGMSTNALAEANERIRTFPKLGVDVAESMGLFVVGQLASRHGIEVRLESGRRGGVVATLRLPAELIVALDPEAPYPMVRPNRAGVRNAMAAAGLTLSDQSAPVSPQSATGGYPQHFQHGVPGSDPGDEPAANPHVPERPVSFTAQPGPFSPDPHPGQYGPPATPGLPGWPESPVEPARPGEPAPDLTAPGGQWLAAGHSPAAPFWPDPFQPAAPEPAPEAAPDRWTSAGLPVRQPMAHLVPELRDQLGNRQQTSELEPEQVRSMLASFYAGVERGRAEDDDAEPGGRGPTT